MQMRWLIMQMFFCPVNIFTCILAMMNSMKMKYESQIKSLRLKVKEKEEAEAKEKEEEIRSTS